MMPGTVALHNDGDQHIAVILDIQGDECEALFFTSRPDWAEKYRRATKDELALAGYVVTKVTYLAYCKRPRWDFQPLGPTFSEHRVRELKEEFLTIPKVVQTVG